MVDAAQEQPLGAVTDTLPVPADEPKDCEAGEMLYVQTGVPAACETVNVWPAMVMVPVRVVVVLAETE